MPEIEYANKITFSQQNKLPFGQVDIDLETLGGTYNAGNDITVTIAGEDVNCYITKIVKELSINGWRQQIHAVTQPGKVAEKAPKKRQIFPIPSSAQSILTANSFPEILILCQTHGVSRIRIGDLDVEFGQAIPRTTQPRHVGSPAQAGAPVTEPVLSYAEGDDLEAEETQRLIDDPMGYEQAQIDGHLNQESPDAAKTHHREAE